MLNRRRLLYAFAAVPLMSQASFAAGPTSVPFARGAFDNAQKAGKSILVKITAPWCPTCKAQRPILDQLTSAPKFKDLAIFEIDFDSQQDLVAAFGANMQSTLIAFKGEHETGRSVGDTNKTSIAALLDKTI